MRKHGWQLPYHQLQVVAVAVFLALGFAFYVFFAPFVGKKLFQYIVMGIYTPLLISSIGLYIWCAGADPADPGVVRSKKYLNIPESKNHVKQSESRHGVSRKEAADKKGNHDLEPDANRNTEPERTKSLVRQSTFCSPLLALLPCAYVCRLHEESSQQSEDGMFYCSLCEVEVYKYSKHCRVCDKCVDRFDHHCRWLNNCIGKRNYRKFFTLMVSALLLLILQWSTGILVLILCFLEKKKFTNDINSKLGSSFTIVPFVTVVAVCTILAMIATLPLAQLFFFHILLIKKGISTYDYIVALREQDQQDVGGQQSPQMSQVSSLTGLSSASSFNTFNRAAFCTPPRLFVEDQYDVVPPDNGSVSSFGKKTVGEEPTKKKNPSAVKISPWTLARLNAEEVSKAASDARKRSKILRPIPKHNPIYGLETDNSSLGSSSHKMAPKPENNKKRGNRRIHLPSDIPLESSLSKIQSYDARNGDHHHIHHHHHMISETSTSLAPLHLEARSIFRENRPMIPGSTGGVITSSPESSVDSPDISPFRVSSSVAEEEARRFVGVSTSTIMTNHLNDIPVSRSTSDGYDASGGEDSDQVPRRIQYRPTTNWNSLLFGNEADRAVPNYMPPSSSATSNHRKI